MDDHPNHPQCRARAFSSKPLAIGCALLGIAFIVLGWSFILAPDQGARDISKIVGAAFGFLGLSAYGFGQLVLAANRPPRRG